MRINERKQEDSIVVLLLCDVIAEIRVFESSFRYTESEYRSDGECGERIPEMRRAVS